MVVIHEMIPHHHHDMEDDIELFSYQHHSNQQARNAETGATNHFPFPSHHHVSASEDFDLARVSTNLERGITFPFSFLIPNYLSWFPEAEPPESKFYSVLTIPLNSHPFIISPNSVRGSPSAA